MSTTDRGSTGAANGRLMAFASLCDDSGVLEATLFEGAAERYGDLLDAGGIVVATGAVTQDVERGVGVEVREVRTLQVRGVHQAARSSTTSISR